MPRAINFHLKPLSLPLSPLQTKVSSPKRFNFFFDAVSCHTNFLFNLNSQNFFLLSFTDCHKQKFPFRLLFLVSLRAELKFVLLASRKKAVGMATFDDETLQKQKPATSTTTFFPPSFCRFAGTPTNLLNPGTIRNLHKKARDLTPEWIEGLSLRCAKNFDVNKTLYAEWLMGNNTPAGFRFGGALSQKDNDNITVINSC